MHGKGSPRSRITFLVVMIAGGTLAAKQGGEQTRQVRLPRALEGRVGVVQMVDEDFERAERRSRPRGSTIARASAPDSRVSDGGESRK